MVGTENDANSGKQLVPETVTQSQPDSPPPGVRPGEAKTRTCRKPRARGHSGVTHNGKKKKKEKETSRVVCWVRPRHGDSHKSQIRVSVFYQTGRVAWELC